MGVFRACRQRCPWEKKGYTTCSSAWKSENHLFILVSLLNVSAQQLSSATSFSKPFRPTVHVLILPSQLPADLRLTFRELDEHYLVSPFSLFLFIALNEA